jgi:hypothetical protein
MVSVESKNNNRRKRVSHRRPNLRAWLLFVLLTAQTLFSPFPTYSAPASQGNDPAASAAGLLELLTPEERVGQLFLVTFEGASAPDESHL